MDTLSSSLKLILLLKPTKKVSLSFTGKKPLKVTTFALASPSGKSSNNFPRRGFFAEVRASLSRVDAASALCYNVGRLVTLPAAFSKTIRI
jgi:hypothetical protein